MAAPLGEAKRRELWGSAALARLDYSIDLSDCYPCARAADPLLSSNAQQQDEQQDDEHELIHDRVPSSWSA